MTRNKNSLDQEKLSTIERRSLTTLYGVLFTVGGSLALAGYAAENFSKSAEKPRDIKTIAVDGECKVTNTKATNGKTTLTLSCIPQ